MKIKKTNKTNKTKKIKKTNKTNKINKTNKTKKIKKTNKTNKTIKTNKTNKTIKTIKNQKYKGENKRKIKRGGKSYLIIGPESRDPNKPLDISKLITNRDNLDKITTCTDKTNSYSYFPNFSKSNCFRYPQFYPRQYERFNFLSAMDQGGIKTIKGYLIDNTGNKKIIPISIRRCFNPFIYFTFDCSYSSFTNCRMWQCYDMPYILIIKIFTYFSS